MPFDNHTLPKQAVIDDVEYEIQYDFRAVLDIMSVMNDAEISDYERARTCLKVFYPDYDEMPLASHDEAIEFLFWFISGGNDNSQEKKQQMKLMDWEQDFSLMVSPINRVIGFDVRATEELHWWTFLAAYYEIGDCFFAQVVSIRKKRASGKKLDKSEEAFYRANQHIIEIKTTLSDTENRLIAHWT